MVLDFRKLNEKSIVDSYPLPNINDILVFLGSAKYFSVFDLATAFHHIKMNPKDSHKPNFLHLTVITNSIECLPVSKQHRQRFKDYWI